MVVAVLVMGWKKYGGVVGGHTLQTEFNRSSFVSCSYSIARGPNIPPSIMSTFIVLCCNLFVTFVFRPCGGEGGNSERETSREQRMSILCKYWDLIYSNTVLFMNY